MATPSTLALNGRYRYVSELGAGGSGRVVRAEDLVGGGDVAVKLVPPDAYALLRAEREAIDRLSHPALVQVRELLRIDGAMGTPWSLPAGSGALVEELVEGPSAAAYFGAMGEADCLAAFWTTAPLLADGLAAVHAAGLVHGDVKPANVLMRGERPVLADFGLAGSPRSSARTLSGTPGFLAPECGVGARTPGTDLFALGVTFQRLLAGASRGGDGHSDNAPEALLELVTQLQQSDASDRPASAQEVAQLLRKLARAAGVAVPEPTGPSVSSSRQVLHLPFVGHAEPIAALVRALHAGGLAIVSGPSGSGRTRLVREAVTRFQVECGDQQRAVPTYVCESEYLPNNTPYILHKRDLSLDHARRALRMAAIDGHRVSWILESSGEDIEEQWCRAGASVVHVGPLEDSEFELLAAEIRRCTGGFDRAAAVRTSGKLAGLLCRSVSTSSSSASSVPSGTEDMALRLALAGGTLSDRTLGDATHSAGLLLAAGAVSLTPAGDWQLRDDLVAGVLDGVAAKRRATLAATLNGGTERQRAHLAAHSRATTAGTSFAAAIRAAFERGQHAEVERLTVEARRFALSSPAIDELTCLSRVAAGEYESALDLATDSATKAEIARKAGRSDLAGKLAPVGPRGAYTRAWLALSASDLDGACAAAAETEGAERAEVLAWVALAEGDPGAAEALAREAKAGASLRVGARLAITLGTALRNRPRAAEAAFREGLSLARSLGERHLEATLEGNLGSMLLAQGQLGSAHDFLRDAAKALVRLGRERDAGRALYNLAHLELTVGQWGGAVTHLEQAEGALVSASDTEGLEMVHVAQAEARAAKGDLAFAQALAKRLKSERARARLAAAVAGAVPDVAEALIAEIERSSVDSRLAAARVRVARGVDAHEILDELESNEHGEEWEDALRIALLGAETRSGVARSQAAARARTLLDLATASLTPEAREIMRRVPAYGRVLSALPSDKVAQSPARWRRLVRAGRRLAAERVPERAMEEFARSALELVDAERVSIVVRATDGELHTQASSGVVMGASEVSRSVVSRALDSGATVASMDALSDELFGAASVHALSLRSLLCVPIPRRAAVLYVEDRLRPAAFSEEDASLLGDLVELAAVALERVERERNLALQNIELERLRHALEERSQRQAVELRSLRPVSRDFVAQSTAMKQIVELAKRVAGSDVPVLVTGESGTGKGMIARLIHRQSERADRPFIAESCAAIPDALLESLLFGHEKGAFTGAESTRVGLFEAASGGTLFLDEVGEMSPSMQAALLRVVQEGELRRVGGSEVHRVDVRVVSATHHDLAERVQRGLFREDLFYRLKVVQLEVPPLRERRGDIAALVRVWLGRQETPTTISKDALDLLSSHSWPGNVRELFSELDRAAALGGPAIERNDLSELVQGARATQGDFKAQIESLERKLIRNALDEHEGNLTRAAEGLGLSRYGLQKMLKRLGIAR